MKIPYANQLFPSVNLESMSGEIYFQLTTATMDNLFIAVHSLTQNNERQIYTSVESFLALYVYRYLGLPANIQLRCLSVPATNTELEDKIKLNPQALNGDLIETAKSSVHKINAINDLRLPIYGRNNNTFIAGLCAVCRELVARHNNKDFHKLLGFKASCLQSSSEASVWTRYCEVDVVQAIQKQLYVQMNIASQKSIELPLELVRFERHMNEPVRMHNIYKQARQQAGKNIMINCSTPKETLSIQHRFVEGIRFTLADLILYPCIHILVQYFPSHMQHFPATRTWLQEVDADFPDCLKLLNIIKVHNNIELESSSLPCTIPHAPATSLYKSDPKRYKPRQRIYTAQNEVDASLNKLSALKINCSSISEHCYEEPHVEWTSIEPRHEHSSALPTERIARKRQQLENLANAVTSVVMKPGSRIVDFCAGTGHLGLLLALQLPACTIILLENKANSLARAIIRANELQLKNILFYQCNIDYFLGDFDIGTSLHACGTATDIVLQQCQRVNAAFVCCPCCYGALQPMPHINYPLSSKYRTVLNEREYLHLAHAADQAHALGTLNCREETIRQGQLCMDIVDTDRKLLAEECGYEVLLTRLQPENCTPKNRLLVGRPCLHKQ